MKIVYSYGKQGYEAQRWSEEIRACSSADIEFIPFNHANFFPWQLAVNSVSLDKAYQTGNPQVRKLQDALLKVLDESQADALFVTNAPPYHPDFLHRIKQYKILYSTDDPGATYERTIPYIHAYDHLMYCAPGYSADFDLGEKLRYAGAKRADWLPLGVFDYEFGGDTAPSVSDRDVDIMYVGACYLQKLEILAAIKRVFGRRVRIHGRFSIKHNSYLVLKHGYLGWITPVDFDRRKNLYRRSKIGFNIHWNHHGLGNQRLYHVPANGAMQICDCTPLLSRVFDVGREVVGYRSTEELIDRARYYLDNESDLQRIATAGHQRVLAEYTLPVVNARMSSLVLEGMAGR